MHQEKIQITVKMKRKIAHNTKCKKKKKTFKNASKPATLFYANEQLTIYKNC